MVLGNFHNGTRNFSQYVFFFKKKCQQQNSAKIKNLSRSRNIRNARKSIRNARKSTGRKRRRIRRRLRNMPKLSKNISNRWSNTRNQ
jgi:hypothetical protein